MRQLGGDLPLLPYRGMALLLGLPLQCPVGMPEMPMLDSEPWECLCPWLMSHGWPAGVLKPPFLFAASKTSSYCVWMACWV